MALEDTHPSVLRLRARLAEAWLFDRLEPKSWEEVFQEIDETFKMLDAAVAFIEIQGLSPDLEQYVTLGLSD
jgi:hypothetical protein